MRIGASTYIWASPFGDDQLHLTDHVAEMGFDVLEICIEDPARVTPERVLEAADRAGVGLSVCGAFGPDRDLSADDADQRERGLEYVKTCIDIAAAVGSPHVAGPMYSATGKARLLPDDEREQQRAWAVENIGRAADYAAERDVRLAIEPLNRFETDRVNTVAQGVELCERIGRDNVGLLLDTFHMNIEERSIPDAIRAAGARAFHVHTCENDRGTPGSGHVEWDGVFGALADIGYDGLIAIEAFTPEIQEIARAVSNWRPVAASQDDLARDGLRFLRQQVAA
jgi:D-psicose/D-tagatose/L-ribulose 3-epimerase